mmetsp:Transcript_4266/g.6221  ORF Transcript_4266/g.6221 Transcript_4266/m.6221 type:complete len:104 (-) Transcript_4266:1077-1388(-)
MSFDNSFIRNFLQRDPLDCTYNGCKGKEKCSGGYLHFVWAMSADAAGVLSSACEELIIMAPSLLSSHLLLLFFFKFSITTLKNNTSYELVYTHHSSLEWRHCT